MRPNPAPAPKRFYERAEAAAEGDAFAVKLDGRSARSPGRRPLAGPKPLIEAMAAEWSGQGEVLDMASMPLTRLHGRRLDADGDAQRSWTETPVRFAATDLLCYRAEDPSLAARQAEVWQPYLDRARERFGVSFIVTTGIVAVDQPGELMVAVRAFANALPAPGRYVLSLLTEITGSAALAINVLTGADANDAFAASRLDERFQAERWGWDAEAKQTEAALERDFGAVVTYARLSES